MLHIVKAGLSWHEVELPLIVTLPSTLISLMQWLKLQTLASVVSSGLRQMPHGSTSPGVSSTLTKAPSLCLVLKAFLWHGQCRGVWKDAATGLAILVGATPAASTATLPEYLSRPEERGRFVHHRPEYCKALAASAAGLPAGTVAGKLTEQH